MKLTRRRLLGAAVSAAPLLGAGCAPVGGETWARGAVQHILPTASSDAFNVKISFAGPLEAAPVLLVRGQPIEGGRQDSAGRFWAFRVHGLAPHTEYALELRAHTGEDAPRLCDPWPLRTLPAPDASPDSARIGAFTCAGGPEVPAIPGLFHAFKPVAYRIRLFEHLLARQPDVVIANGDHVYFDLPMMEAMQASGLGGLAAALVDGLAPVFDDTLSVLGTENEGALTAVGDDQIASIYGVRFRSTPVFFVTDDHDYFINDDATPEGMTLPPTPFHRELRDALQRLYFPEFIATASLPEDLPGRSREAGLALSSYFGELRFGDLFAALLYDCGGHLSLGEDARLVPPSAEAWLEETTQREDTAHLAHVPSHPLGWTAGKWREWYPDQLESTGTLLASVGTDEAGGKYGWQAGWWRQHQRLVRMLTSQTRRAPLVVSGDLHALGIARIERSGELDLGRNALFSVLSGPVGVGDLGWPSRARGVISRIPESLDVRELLPLEERNGFTMLDVTRDRVEVDVLGAPAGWTRPSALEVESVARLTIEAGAADSSSGAEIAS